MEIPVTRYFPDQVFEWTRNAWRKSPEKKRNAPKMAILTKKSKIFIKAKLTVSKSYLLGLVYWMISCIIRDAHLQSSLAERSKALLWGTRCIQKFTTETVAKSRLSLTRKGSKKFAYAKRSKKNNAKFALKLNHQETTKSDI